MKNVGKKGIKGGTCSLGGHGVRRVHCFVFDSCDAVHVDNDVVVIEEMEQMHNVIEFVV